MCHIFFRAAVKDGPFVLNYTLKMRIGPTHEISFFKAEVLDQVI